MHSSRSPLRYPGGKNKFYHQIENVILDNDLYGCSYCEPFAGGAGIAIRLLENKIVSQIYINDLDPGVYAFWHSILFENEKFLSHFRDIPVSIEERNRQKTIYQENSGGQDLFSLGFAFFYLNRTNRSGIIDGGPIGGYSQTSAYTIGCRFNKIELEERIHLIFSHRNQIMLSNLDANEFIKTTIPGIEGKKFVFLDPPYFVKGKKLYLNAFCPEDHKTLCNTIVENLRNVPFVITYDSNKEIKEIYQDFTIRNYKLQYSAGVSGLGDEIIIFDNKLIKMIFSKKSCTD